MKKYTFFLITFFILNLKAQDFKVIPQTLPLEIESLFSFLQDSPPPQSFLIKSQAQKLESAYQKIPKDLFFFMLKSLFYKEVLETTEKGVTSLLSLETLNDEILKWDGAKKTYHLFSQIIIDAVISDLKKIKENPTYKERDFLKKKNDADYVRLENKLKLLSYWYNSFISQDKIAFEKNLKKKSLTFLENITANLDLLTSTLKKTNENNLRIFDFPNALEPAPAQELPAPTAPPKIIQQKDPIESLDTPQEKSALPSTPKQWVPSSNPLQ